MTYTSLESSDQAQYPYSLRIAHLYGNLMNTYGDNGNILMLKYVAEKLGARVTVDIVSLKDRFDPDAYDIAFSVEAKTTNRLLYPRIYQIKKKTSNASLMKMVWSWLSVVAFNF